MPMRIRLKPLASLLFLLLITGLVQADGVFAAISAPSIVVLDPESDQILFSRTPYRKQLPASTAKLVTALVVLDVLQLDHWVRVSPKAQWVEKSKLYLREGDELRVRDLLKSLLMKSANDAATALAIEVSGSERAFADLMTAKARSLGARNTRFINASGLVLRVAIRRPGRPPLAFFERPEWMRAWFRAAADEVIALCRQLNPLLEGGRGSS